MTSQNVIQIGVLDGGLHHQSVFTGLGVEFIEPARTGSIAPERFDIVVVPFHTDQVALQNYRQELENHVKAGGILIVFGACDLNNTRWIPFCRWTQEYTQNTELVTEHPAAAQVFDGLTGPDLRFHSKYHAHGALVLEDPAHSNVLAIGSGERPVMVLTEYGSGGAAIITSLDPDHHLIESVAGPNKMTSAQARANAQKLFDNIMNFARNRASEKREIAGWPLTNANKIFLSHKSKNKEMVRKFRKLLSEQGFSPWLDEDQLKAGKELERDLLQGMKESCAAVFFITPDFKDEGYLAKEVDYAIAEKDKKGKRFSIITIVFSDDEGNKGKVPDLLKRYVYKEEANQLDALWQIVSALPIKSGTPIWV